MSPPPKEPSNGSENDGETNTRKRVCKACDRCRLKKSKCDGDNPCSRCQADNAICVFGERRRSHDKVFPKGYVEMLEQQQEKLVNAIRAMYDLLEKREGWPGLPLQKTAKGHPLTHDILERLGCLHLGDDEGEGFFEDDPSQLLARMIPTSKPDVSYPHQNGATPNSVKMERNSSSESGFMDPFSRRTSTPFGSDKGMHFQHTPPLQNHPLQNPPLQNPSQYNFSSTIPSPNTQAFGPAWQHPQMQPWCYPSRTAEQTTYPMNMNESFNVDGSTQWPQNPRTYLNQGDGYHYGAPQIYSGLGHTQQGGDVFLPPWGGGLGEFPP